MGAGDAYFAMFTIFKIFKNIITLGLIGNIAGDKKYSIWVIEITYNQKNYWVI